MRRTPARHERCRDIFSEPFTGRGVALYRRLYALDRDTGRAAFSRRWPRGCYGGLTDRIITAVTNVMMAIPGLPDRPEAGAYLDLGAKKTILAISVTA